jgi:PilZ domain
MYSVTGPFLEDVAFPRLIKLTKATTERRRWPRAHLRWQVQFFSPDSEPLKYMTSNVSTGGFYILSDRPFKPGESLNCFLSIPSYRSRQNGETLLVQCRVEVVRVEGSADGNQFGTACRILDYRAWGGDASA